MRTRGAAARPAAFTERFAKVNRLRRMRSSIRFFAITLVFVLSACASYGDVDKTFTPNQAPKTIFDFERQSDTEARQLESV